MDRSKEYEEWKEIAVVEIEPREKRQQAQEETSGFRETMFKMDLFSLPASEAFPLCFFLFTFSQGAACVVCSEHLFFVISGECVAAAGPALLKKRSL